MDLPVYLDYNATTPCDPRVVDVMLPYFTKFFGNAASRSHLYGWQADEAVAVAREQIASLIKAEPKEIVFTSGATESVNLALKGVFEAYAAKGNHIITLQTEHQAVLDSCSHLEKLGAVVDYLPVGPDGLVDTQLLESHIKAETILIAVMFANNETGVIQPMAAISEIARRYEVLFFTDATQAVGKVLVTPENCGADLIACSAHKMYGPKGVGALYVKRRSPRVRIMAQLDGGGHERGMRSGTLNVAGIVGFGKASELCENEMGGESQRLSSLRDRLEKGIVDMKVAGINGSINSRMPHVTNLSFYSEDGEALMMQLSRDLAVSAGSACNSASLLPSHVLKALGLSDIYARSSLRFSLGRFTSEDEIDYAIGRIAEVVGNRPK